MYRIPGYPGPLGTETSIPPARAGASQGRPPPPPPPYPSNMMDHHLGYTPLVASSYGINREHPSPRSHGGGSISTPPGLVGQLPLPQQHHHHQQHQQQHMISFQTQGPPLNDLHAPRIDFPPSGPADVPRMSNMLFHPMHRPQPAYLSFEIPHHPDMAAIKLTRGTSCVLCQQRKVRCDKKKPCANCIKARVDCRVVPPAPPRRRRKRLHERDLVDRLRKYEALLAEHGVDFDSIEADLKLSPSQRATGPDGEDVGDLGDEFDALKTSLESTVEADCMVSGPKKHHKASQATSNHPFRDSSDEDDYDGSAIHDAFDEMYGGQEGFPFVVAGRDQPVTHLHPPFVQIMQLWNVYLSNVNPILRITHVPTIQALVIEGSADLAAVPKNVEALMFAIYFMAVTSLDDNETRRMFGQPKSEMQARYHSAVQQALVNAGFMTTNDLLSLTAFLLYLFAIRQTTDPRQIFCLIGIAVRIAHRMGLHRDGSNSGFSPFETEQRRRLWWTMVGFDRRMGEMAGCTVTALSTLGDCRLPLNIDDSDIHVDATDAPVSRNGPTEMAFALSWLELSMAITSDTSRDSLALKAHDKKTPAPPPAERLVRLAHQKDSPVWTIDGFCAHIEGAYLGHCDPKIPLHFFTLTMMRQGLCKIRVISFLMRLVRPAGPKAQTLNQLERDNLFLEAVQMIEHDNVVQSAQSLRSFKWYTYFHFPFPAYMFLFNELKHRPTGPMVERAWAAINDNHELRGLANHLHSPMHIAFGSHLIKAWSAHERGMEAAGKPVGRPRWFINLKKQVEKRNRSGGGGPLSDPSSSRMDRAPPVREEQDEEEEKEQGESQSPQAQTEQKPPVGLGPPQQQENPIVLTPPEDGGARGPACGATPGSDSDFDWGYLLQEYQQGGMLSFQGGSGGHL